MTIHSGAHSTRDDNTFSSSPHHRLDNVDITVEFIRKSMDEWNSTERICPFCLRSVSLMKTAYHADSKVELTMLDEEKHSDCKQREDHEEDDVLYEHVSKCMNFWKMERGRRQFHSDINKSLSMDSTLECCHLNSSYEDHTHHKRNLSEVNEMDPFLSTKKMKHPNEQFSATPSEYSSRFNQIGNDMIFHILEYLDSRFCVQVCAKISKQWNAQVLRIPLSIKFFREEEIDQEGTVLAKLDQFVSSSTHQPNLTSLEIDELPNFNERIVELIAGSKKMSRLNTLILDYNDLSANCLRSISSSEHLKGLTKLSLNSCSLSDEGVAIIVNSNNMKELRELCMNCCDIGNEDLRAISASKWMSNLTALHLQDNVFDCVEPLCKSSFMSTLAHLNVDGLHLETDAIRQVTESTFIHNLRILDYGFNEMKAEGATILAQCPNAHNITSLNLMSCKIKNKGIEAIVTSQYLKNVTSLILTNNYIDIKGISCLVKSENVKHLKELDLSENGKTGKQGAELISSCAYLKNLTILGLGKCSVGDDGISAIAGSEYMSNLTCLHISQNEIGVAGIKALSKTEYVKNLRTLDLSNNSIDENGMQAMSLENTFKNLTSLDLSSSFRSDDCLRHITNTPSFGKLRYLALRSDSVGHEGLMMLFKSPYMQNITSLDLRDNFIQGEYLIKLIRSHPNLTSLKL
ncbi:hypothetical protein FDP41_005025 [Naegleria fowleri]|uniref:Uncharacterized protein n=1 Tax=Naegleria fowleri TaxID=5763 RepID=A0A6A5BNG9_NAEFO|nr:uncharacterized protein FDP41_005025 [Naegleria fowleri]KAF0975698.1 hypothetical protein FDP41_005025 [Naegleria fowleri]